MYDYLTFADVLALHEVLIRRHGGAPGLRDPGALESALFRPQTGYYSDIIAEAAALMESLAVNHPFVDGNKRIAFAVTDVFLRINGWRLQRQPMQIYEGMIGFFEAGCFEYKMIDAWLREFVVQQEGSL